MNRAITVQDPTARASLRRAFETLGFEVIPFKKTEEAIVTHVPKDVRLTVTASPAKGQDATVDLAVKLAGHGYNVAPHLSAQQVRDRGHLADIVACCREAGITEVFVVGGDPTDTPTQFEHARDLLVALHELDSGFTDIGIAGHPEGHPAVSDEVLFQALKDKAPMATHIKTQIVFDTKVILNWARELRRRGIDLPVHVGVPGAVHRQKLLRMSAGLGIGESAKFLKKQQSLFWRFFVPGGYNPYEIIKGLAQHIGKPDNTIEGFHVFTFNDLEPTEAWRRRTLQSLSSRAPTRGPVPRPQWAEARPSAPTQPAPPTGSGDAMTAAATKSSTAALRTTPVSPRDADLGRLLIRCLDRPGIVSAVSTFLTQAGANIVSLDQHSTTEGDGAFFQRTAFHLTGLPAARDELERSFASEVAERFDMEFRLVEAARPKRVAIMVSQSDHCVLDLLWRNRRGELDMSVAMVISNHPNLASEIRPFGVPYFHIPAARENRAEAEQRQLELLRDNVDLVVLARYMQIISPEFLAQVGCPLINIHHSFLPAFIGAGPYRKAKDRGVKLIGATAHYVTEELDKGPIIEQDVVRVNHRHSTADLIRLGADVERVVLSRAVRWHCEDRVARHGNTTLIF